MKTNNYSKKQIYTSFYFSEKYTQPKVEVLSIQVEKGFLTSFSSGDSEGSVSTDGDFGWDDEIEL